MLKIVNFSEGFCCSSWTEGYLPCRWKRDTSPNLLIEGEICIVCKEVYRVLVSNFSLVVNDVFFLLGDSPTSEFYFPTSAHKIQTPGNHPKEIIQLHSDKQLNRLYVSRCMRRIKI